MADRSVLDKGRNALENCVFGITFKRGIKIFLGPDSLIQPFLDMEQMSLEEVYFPDHVRINEVELQNNWIEHLEVPSSIISLDCSDNPMNALILKEGIKRLYCDNAQLSALHIPDSLEYLRCDNIKLSGNLDCKIDIVCNVDESEIIEFNNGLTQSELNSLIADNGGID